MTAYTYIVECADGTYYTGWTNDLDKRMAAHNSGQGAKYTRGRLPVHLVYFEQFDDKREAQSREVYIKQMTRAEKAALIDAGRSVGMVGSTVVRNKGSESDGRL